jgi:hypothetical protein
MLLWAIEPDPLPWAMVSWFIPALCPTLSCFMLDSFDIAEFPILPWDIVSCDMVDELWANVGTTNATAIRAVAAKVGTRLNMMTPSLDVHAAGRFLDLRTNCASGEAASFRIAGRQPIDA